MSRSQDVVILHVNDAAPWCSYLSELFKKNKHITIKPMNMDEQDYENPPEVLEAVNDTFLVLLIASPDMVDFMKDKAWLSSALDKLPVKTTVVVALCFVDEVQFHSALGSSYKRSSSWKRYVLTGDQKKCIDIVADILDIIDESEPHPPPRPLPKSRGQKRSPNLRVYPSKVHEPHENVIIAFGREMKGTIQVSFDRDDVKVDSKPLNPYTRKFKAPDKRPGSYTLYVYHDGKEIHKTPFSYMAPHESAFTSVEYLCQTFQCDDHAALDRRLVDILESSVPEDNSLQTLFDKVKHSQTGPLKAKSQYPTLLHFAAASGLFEFTSLLLDIPGSLAAFQIENHEGRDPADLADHNNHHELAQYIRDFMATSYVADACDLYMAMAQLGSYKNVESGEPVMESNYMAMGGVAGGAHPVHDEEPEEPEDLYTTAGGLYGGGVDKPPPPLQPRAKHLPPVPKTAKHRRNTDAAPPTYQAPPPPTLSRVQSARLPSVPKPAASTYRKGSTLPAGLSPSVLRDMEDSDCEISPSNDKMELNIEPLPKTALGSNSQNELLDIMNGVKAGKFDPNEALMLFNSWKERNGDGHQSKSFKERQKTLRRMRDEYSEMIYNMEKSADQSKQGFFSRLVSKRQKPAKHVPDITDPIPHRKSKGTRHKPSHLVPDDPRHSSSSSSSRESTSSLNNEPDGSSDDSDSGTSDSPVLFRSRKISSTSSYEGDKRQSRKLEFLAEAEMMEELPPLPPRTYTRSDLPKPTPKPRPMMPPRR